MRLKHHWTVLAALPVLRVVVSVVLRYYGGVRVTGKDHIPRTGPVLLTPNHLSDLDPVVTQLACPRPIHFMAKQPLFEMKYLGAFMRWYGAFPVNQNTADRKALDRAIKLLQAGEVVCIYPEGGLSKSGDLLPLQPGIALVARKGGHVPVVPLRIDDSQRINPYEQAKPQRSHRPVRLAWKPQINGPHDDARALIDAVTEALRPD